MEWMLPIWEWIKNAGSVGLVAAGATYLIQIATASFFKRRLSEHAESLKHSFSKELLKIECNFSKKHQVYPELYSLLVKAESSSLGLLGFYSSIDTRNFGKSEVENELNAIGWNKGQIKEILAIFDLDEQKGRKCLDKALNLRRVICAEDCGREARNFLALNRLYLSKGTFESAYSLLKQYHEVCVYCKSHIQSNYLSQGCFEKAHSVKKKIEKEKKLENSVEPLMREELGQDSEV